MPDACAPDHARIRSCDPLRPSPGPLARCGPVRQCAYVVADLEAAVEWWTAVGVGPFLAMPRAADAGLRAPRGCRRAGADDRLRQLGDLQIELIAAHDDRPSPFREALDAGHEGAHHLAWWVGDWTGWEHLAAEPRVGSR